MYPSPLAAALSGASLGQLEYWRKKPPLLVPQYVSSNRVLYSYKDVVALRSLAYLRQKEKLSLQKIRISVHNLRRLGKDAHLSEYKLIRMGDTVVVAEGGQTIDLLKRPGNYVVAELVDVFGEFEGRQGRVLPFQRPIRGVAVDPEVRAGYPVVEGTRVGYDQVAGLMRDNVPAEEVPMFFPSVTPESARAALEFDSYVNTYAVSESA
ncbi:DUF433 domain-containing protein [Bailinhaonella thermotolerans]|uniref:DUF433 domain-containing protein n=1 Tax=Bailinhaonella thermotolerans TaxID=1070861 RepID=A0A3A4A9N2_9ACTN|nr:DUF433 domain-containing protein [Bailinhaonella thermotolerans]RJL22036.1 DUF433 domain-containing protein [Bailinhaonella thermotolerans]